MTLLISGEVSMASIEVAGTRLKQNTKSEAEMECLTISTQREVEEESELVLEAQGSGDVTEAVQPRPLRSGEDVYGGGTPELALERTSSPSPTPRSQYPPFAGLELN
ncbi:hypothetical protein Cni_G15362 [Canna indica]|uniref:Uncharacterized protein n=1 Tax=Canna indica TaxID=4628 RepID=A0AAQ3QET1_9LILI|nr:hypothetical protein Cni_G15362 [Canna indica]